MAERSGDTAFRLRTELPKRRGASLPAAVQKGLVAATPRCEPLLTSHDLTRRLRTWPENLDRRLLGAIRDAMARRDRRGHIFGEERRNEDGEKVKMAMTMDWIAEQVNMPDAGWAIPTIAL